MQSIKNLFEPWSSNIWILNVYRGLPSPTSISSPGLRPWHPLPPLPTSPDPRERRRASPLALPSSHLHQLTVHQGLCLHHPRIRATTHKASSHSNHSRLALGAKTLAPLVERFLVIAATWRCTWPPLILTTAGWHWQPKHFMSCHLRNPHISAFQFFKSNHLTFGFTDHILACKRICWRWKSLKDSNGIYHFWQQRSSQ